MDCTTEIKEQFNYLVDLHQKMLCSLFSRVEGYVCVYGFISNEGQESAAHTFIVQTDFIS